MKLEFGTPPSEDNGNSSTLWAEEAAALRGRKGEWAKLDTSHMKPTSRIQFPSLVNQGRYKAFREGFEARGSQGETWIRYVGDGK